MMTLPPAVAGATKFGLLITWEDEDGNPVDLSDSILSGRLQTQPDKEARDIAGSLALSVSDDNNQFTWTYNAADVVQGEYHVMFIATYPDTRPAKTLAAKWTVHEAF